MLGLNKVFAVTLIIAGIVAWKTQSVNNFFVILSIFIICRIGWKFMTGK